MPCRRDRPLRFTPTVGSRHRSRVIVVSRKPPPDGAFIWNAEHAVRDSPDTGTTCHHAPRLPGTHVRRYRLFGVAAAVLIATAAVSGFAFPPRQSVKAVHFAQPQMTVRRPLTSLKWSQAGKFYDRVGSPKAVNATATPNTVTANRSWCWFNVIVPARQRASWRADAGGESAVSRRVAHSRVILPTAAPSVEFREGCSAAAHGDAGRHRRRAVARGS